MEYADWTQETLKTAVVFKENSTAIILNLPSVQDWDIIGKTSPLVVSSILKQNSLYIVFSCTVLQEPPLKAK